MSMRIKRVYSRNIAISILMIMVLYVGFSVSACGTESDTPSGTISGFQADISGNIIVAEKVRCLTPVAVPPSTGEVFWIVAISVKNNSYSSPVGADFQKAYKGWVITASNQIYRPVYCGSAGENPLINLSVGQQGKFMLHFSVPKTLQVGDAQMCYQGQVPYSCGNLSYVDKVYAYDWMSKTVIAKEAPPVVEVKIAEDWKIQLDSKSWSGGTLNVKLTITNLGLRQNFGYAGFNVGPELAVIDSTGKLVEPWVPLPDTRKGVMITLPPYTREFYPNESWTGSLKFELSPYSGKTSLYMTRFYHARKYLLFDCGEPGK